MSQTKPPNENGYCKHCGLDFDGGDIKQTFIDQGNTPERAAEIAEMYGYGPGRTQWGKQIGIEEGRDRIEWYQCPDCKGRNERSEIGRYR